MHASAVLRGLLSLRGQRTRLALAGAGGLALIAFLGGVALAAGLVDANGRINACVNNETGVVRLLPSRLPTPLGTSCDTTAANPLLQETPLSWNQTGPAGPQGPKGDTGAVGRQGPQGPAGAAGSPGVSGYTTISKTDENAFDMWLSCPDGLSLLGGGAGVSWSDAYLHISRPYSATAWYASLQTINSVWHPGLTVWIICAKVS